MDPIEAIATWFSIICPAIVLCFIIAAIETWLEEIGGFRKLIHRVLFRLERWLNRHGWFYRNPPAR